MAVEKSHPIQPLIMDSEGVLRFKSNAIVRYLLDEVPFDMNKLAAQGFSVEDREQFAQLIGYSLSGFSDLSYVRDETWDTANNMKEIVDERDARIEALQYTIGKVREGLRIAVPAVFKGCPEDLEC